MLFYITHLGDGVDGIPALWQDLWVGVIEKADEAWQQGACMGAVVQASTSKVGIEDRDGSLSEAGISTSCGLQQVLNDDALAYFIFHW